jgi:hypothetical protein
MLRHGLDGRTVLYLFEFWWACSNSIFTREFSTESNIISLTTRLRHGLTPDPLFLLNSSHHKCHLNHLPHGPHLQKFELTKNGFDAQTNSYGQRSRYARDRPVTGGRLRQALVLKLNLQTSSVVRPETRPVSQPPLSHQGHNNCNLSLHNLQAPILQCRSCALIATDHAPADHDRRRAIESFKLVRNLLFSQPFGGRVRDSYALADVGRQRGCQRGHSAKRWRPRYDVSGRDDAGQPFVQ